VPKANSISPKVGLHPRVTLSILFIITGGVTSAVHVTVRAAVEVLPQASLAIHVLVWEREQPSLVMLPSLEDTVGTPQASVAVAVPNAPLISPADGLQPRVVVVPPVVSTGGVRSSIQLTVLDVVDVLPQ
jgi:hypothetical protein